LFKSQHYFSPELIFNNNPYSARSTERLKNIFFVLVKSV